MAASGASEVELMPGATALNQTHILVRPQAGTCILCESYPCTGAQAAVPLCSECSVDAKPLIRSTVYIIA